MRVRRGKNPKHSPECDTIICHRIISNQLNQRRISGQFEVLAIKYYRLTSGSREDDQFDLFLYDSLRESVIRTQRTQVEVLNPQKEHSFLRTKRGRLFLSVIPTTRILSCCKSFDRNESESVTILSCCTRHQCWRSFYPAFATSENGRDYFDFWKNSKRGFKDLKSIKRHLDL